MCCILYHHTICLLYENCNDLSFFERNRHHFLLLICHFDVVFIFPRQQFLFFIFKIRFHVIHHTFDLERKGNEIPNIATVLLLVIQYDMRKKPRGCTIFLFLSLTFSRLMVTLGRTSPTVRSTKTPPTRRNALRLASNGCSVCSTNLQFNE